MNADPYGGKKLPAAQVYVPRIYGFKVSERAKGGPRMQWLRARPQDQNELDLVDWKGRWIGSDAYEEDEDEEEMGQMEDFDPVCESGFVSDLNLIWLTRLRQDHGDDDDEESEEEEEEEEGPATITPNAHVPSKQAARGKVTFWSGL